MATGKRDKTFVASIDIGTTYSGYAFSFKHDYEREPTAVKVNQKWVAGTSSLLSLKTSTVVLFDKNKKFHSFGFEAENKYSNLAEDEEHRDWYFFKKFKMKLHGKKVTRDIVIPDDKGREMKAMIVFGAAIKYLKDHLLNLLKTRKTQVDDKVIHWVITVPAIWTDSAKQFMRESAYEAGIDGALLSIALEPEAASLFCQIPPSDQSIIGVTERAKFALVQPGTKYMVIDLGGGTADITVHEKQSDGGLKEIHKATGGAWGGTKVDDEFSQMLIRIIGGPVYQKFCDDKIADFLDLQRELETAKRLVKPTTDDKITMRVPVSISEIYRKMMKEEVTDALDASRYKGKIKWNADKMRIDPGIFKSFFKPCTEKLIAHLNYLMKKPDVQGTSIFLMVGGFSESDIMQTAVTDAFPKVSVVVPEDAGLTIVKGAVIFGHKPITNRITARKAKYTYGINISPPFDPSIHPEDHRVTVGGVDRCRDVFKKYIQEGETVLVHEPRTGKHVTLKAHQKEMLLKIFASEKSNPQFVDECEVEYIGPLIVKLPDTPDKIRVEVRMKFGETELMVEAEEQLNHEVFTAYFDFC
ncbi:heat shock 70 kDa protein 12A-like [Ruditapes philippinarum]|uniref:heat shock 70 kDa protein 12A-like n=1 Tax=Ruditapes philippinarum TaxID=129788 RepID=UPI00295C0C7E|nr:heat shock 70 kDa protein 12A-like [Ruditapes philippinarum]XP_060586882.1 heat shock 70 kDa protein 12A-like [Ruditapes philippinarum]